MAKQKPKVKKSKGDAWMPLYVGDYLADTTRLTTEQHGAYMLLIMDYWRNGPLPDNDAIMCQITKMTSDAWSNAKAILLAFFEHQSGKFVHKRIEQEKFDAAERVQKHHERAVVAAEARWAKEDATSNATSTPKAMLEECQSQSQSQSQSIPSPIQGENVYRGGYSSGEELAW